MRFATMILMLAAAAMLAGCPSTPTRDGAGAPIQEGTTPKGPDGQGPGTQTSPRSGPGTVDLTKNPPAVGAMNELTDPKSPLSRRSVYFDFDKFDVKEEFRAMLQAHAQYLSRNRSAKILVQGNTDERGSREYNIGLGQRRAEAIKRTLVLLGAPESAIEAVSLGKEKPRRSGHSEEDYAENRRGDILYSSGNVKEF